MVGQPLLCRYCATPLRWAKDGRSKLCWHCDRRCDKQTCPLCKRLGRTAPAYPV